MHGVQLHLQAVLEEQRRQQEAAVAVARAEQDGRLQEAAVVVERMRAEAAETRKVCVAPIHLFVKSMYGGCGIRAVFIWGKKSLIPSRCRVESVPQCQMQARVCMKKRCMGADIKAALGIPLWIDATYQCKTHKYTQK